MRWLSILRDPRIWMAIALAALIRGGFAVYWNWTVEERIAAYEAELAALPPEQRIDRELETLDRIAKEVAGVDVSAELREVAELQKQALRVEELAAAGEVDPALIRTLEQELAELEARPLARPARQPVATVTARDGQLPVIAFQPEAPEPQPMPPWLAAGLFGGGVLLIGAVGALLILRQEGEQDPDPGAGP